jgi:lipoprotein-anchoring transpeptidase ErfK/SrfK
MIVRGWTLARAGGLRTTGRIGLALAAVAASGALAACSESNASDDDSDSDDASSTWDFITEEISRVKLTPSVASGERNVTVDTRVTVEAADGTIDDVVLSYNDEGRKRQVPGAVSDDDTVWAAKSLLEPGERYRLVMRGENTDGEPLTERSRFRTEDLTLDEQTYMEYIQPYDGETYGVGMPVILQFDIPVTDRASIEQSLHVTSTPKVEGTWHWYSDTEVHYRPKSYWPSGAKVHVDADINGVSAGNGIYGQESEEFDFRIGRKVISKIDLDKHRMKVFIDDQLANTIPVTGGMPGYETRSGTKVIMEKYETKDMDAATTGVSENDPEYYNIANVPNALRVTWSGEFLHGAPWSEGSQGFANVSHGCVGMSVENSEWMYANTRIGDVVKVTGSNRSIEPGNGWTDWDVPWGEYVKGSALN